MVVDAGPFETNDGSRGSDPQQKRNTSVFLMTTPLRCHHRIPHRDDVLRYFRGHLPYLLAENAIGDTHTVNPAV